MKKLNIEGHAFPAPGLSSCICCRRRYSVLILLFSYFLVHILLSGGKLSGCVQQNRQCGNRYFKPFVLKTLPDPPCCGGSQFADRYRGQKGSRCCRKLTSDRRHLFSTGRTDSQKCWSETSAQNAFEFLLSLCATAFRVLGDAGGIPVGAQMEMQKSWCPARLLPLCLRLAPAAPKALGRSGTSLALTVKLPGWEFCLIWSNPPCA